MRTTTIVSLAAVAALGLSACGSETSTTEATPAATSSSAAATGSSSSPAPAGTSAAPDAATTPGAYLTQAEYESQMAAREGTKIVYFFHADWCPSCRATDAAVAADGVPDGLTVVKVDYDTETDLRKEYGVTQQHTFVQVDPDGGELAKWTGSVSGADIEAKTV
ncbi:MAG: thioredoxin family protein [Ornithinibacter sp.]